MSFAYFALTHLTLCYVVPLLVIVVSYVLVGHRIWRRQILGSHPSDEVERQARQLQQTKLRALRMVAMIKTPAARQQLERYLVEGTNAELQMGAVSGLSDRDEDGVAGLMIQASGYLPDVNLKLAVESLTRDERRSLELLDAISNSKFSAAARKQLNESALLQHSSERVRLQAAEVLK